MIGGVAVLAIFAALWGVAALASIQAPSLLYGLPISISLVAVIVAKRFFDDVPTRPQIDQKRIGRLIMIWSAVEGAGIFIAVNIVLNINRPDLIMAAICAVVGMHFIPLARGMPQRSYYVTGLAMLALAFGGFVAPRIVSPSVIGLGAAVVLWLTIAGLFYRARGLPHGRLPTSAD